MADHITAEWTDLTAPDPGTIMYRVGHAGLWWTYDDSTDLTGVDGSEVHYARVVECVDGQLRMESIEKPE